MSAVLGSGVAGGLPAFADIAEAGLAPVSLVVVVFCWAKIVAVQARVIKRVFMFGRRLRSFVKWRVPPRQGCCLTECFDSDFGPSAFWKWRHGHVERGGNGAEQGGVHVKNSG